MRGNVPDLDLPTPADTRHTDRVDLTDLNQKLTQSQTHTLIVAVICCVYSEATLHYHPFTFAACAVIRNDFYDTGRNVESELYYTLCNSTLSVILHPAPNIHGCHRSREGDLGS